MTRTHMVTGLAVSTAIAVVAIFFIFNPFQMQSSVQAGASQPVGSGLIVQDEVVGMGDVAVAGMVVSVNYTGKFQDGKVFDTSVGRAPFQFTLGAGQVISGWDQGLIGMKVGGKRLLIIPPELAYGPQGVGPIPPNATLVFEVDLLSVKTASQAPTAPEGPSAY